MRRWLSAALALALLAAPPAAAAPPVTAVGPEEILDDPALEARARAIGRELRCLVCRNQSIDDSKAPLARDLRLLVRERLRAGDSDAAVRDYVVARYGEYVLLRPPFKPETWLLWLGAPLMLAGGALGAALAFRRRASRPEPPPLTDDERRRLEKLLEEPR